VTFLQQRDHVGVPAAQSDRIGPPMTLPCAKRGEPDVWFSEAIVAWKTEPRATRGGQPRYSGSVERARPVEVLADLHRRLQIGGEPRVAFEVVIDNWLLDPGETEMINRMAALHTRGDWYGRTIAVFPMDRARPGNLGLKQVMSRNRD